MYTILFGFSVFIFAAIIICCIKEQKLSSEKIIALMQHKPSDFIIKKVPKVVDINGQILFKADLISDDKQNKKFIRIEKASPLIIAIIYNHSINLIKTLIKQGADINLCDENKNSPFLYAALYYSNPEIFDVLIEAGADKNAVNVLDANALMIAVYNSNIEILKKIISLGLDVNWKNKGGWTALMSVALDSRPIEIAALLIENGANIEIKNKIGNSAFEIAGATENNEFIKFLNELNK